jgi:hypothetical protein
MNRLPKCKHHKEKFVPKYPFQKFCLSDEECIKAFNEWVKEEKEKKKAKEWQKEKKEIEESLKTKSSYEKDLEKPINKIAVLIDKGSGCISCNSHKSPQGGHYRSVKSNGTLRFNLHNIHLQDYYCNVEKSANIIEYDNGLIERYGKEYWEYVKFELTEKYKYAGLTINELKEKTQIAKQIVKYLEAENKTYNAKERIELRNKFNKMIGIYN